MIFDVPPPRVLYTHAAASEVAVTGAVPPVYPVLAVVIVVNEKAAEPPPWHLCCRHCGEFALVKTGDLPRGPPTCALRQSA